MAHSSVQEHEKLRELYEEQERMKLKMLQADAGLIQGKDLIVIAERMDWMYHNPAAQTLSEQQVGGSAQANLPVSRAQQEHDEVRERLHARANGSKMLFMPSLTVQNEDTLRRLREDPFFLIKRAEYRQQSQNLERDKIIKSIKKAKKQAKKAKLKKDRENEKRERSYERPTRSKASSLERPDKRHASFECGLQSRHQDERGGRKHSHPQDQRDQSVENPLRRCSRVSLSRSRSPRRGSTAICRRETRGERNHVVHDNVDSLNCARNLSKKDQHYGSKLDDGHSEPPKRSHVFVDGGEAERSEVPKESSLSSRDFSRSLDRGSSSDGEDKSGQGSPTAQMRTFQIDRVQQGPVLPLEWRARLANQEAEGPLTNQQFSDSDSSTESDDIAPPPQMESIIEARRLKNVNPFQRRRPGQFQGLNAQTATPRPEPPGDSHPSSVTEQVSVEDLKLAGKRCELESTLSCVCRYEAAKEKKLEMVEKIERLQTTLEEARRVATIQSASNPSFVEKLQRKAYLESNEQLSDRLRRYAARRQREADD